MQITRNLYVLDELQVGYNLSPAIGILMIVPFALATSEKYKRIIFNILFLSILIFFALIGARGAILSLIGMFLFIKYYHLFSRKKLLYSLTFIILLLSITFFYFLYMALSLNTLEGVVSNDSLFNILQKRLGTRIDIWSQVIYFIGNEPFFGYGTNMSTSLQAPSPNLHFLMYRDNIAAHSTYLEILFRSGFIGLIIYLLFWYHFNSFIINY